MSVIEIDNLAFKVDHLIETVKNLQQKNEALQHKLAVFAQERARLQHQNQQASTKIKQIILQLKGEAQ